MATSQSAIGRRRRKRSSVRGTAAKVGAAKKRTSKVGAARKSPTKKVSGAKKKAPAAVGSMTFNNKRYMKESCHTTKKAAQETAKKLRSQGKLARVVERCVFSRSK